MKIYDVEFDHFQVEFEAHIWWLSSPHEYFKMVDYQLHSSLGDGRTRNRVFSRLYYSSCYSKLHWDITTLHSVGGRKIRTPELKSEIRYCVFVFCIPLPLPKIR